MLSRTPKIAVLVPTYNGGNRLLDTVRSCSDAGIAPDRLMVVVSDNCSDDGSIERLAQSTASGHLHLSRNARNLGRVENWNRATMLAAELGAEFFTFLMVGDELLPGHALLRITGRMAETGADLALAPFRIRRASQRERTARNFLRGRREVREGRELILAAIRSGALFFGPIQANVYRVDRSCPLRFDPEDPVHTDQKATIAWLGAKPRKALLWNEPYCVWREHSERFHMKMNVAGLMEGDLAYLRALAAQYQVEVDWAAVNAALFLLRVRDTHSGVSLWKRTRIAASVLRRSAPGLHSGTILRLLYSKLARGSMVQLPGGAC